LPNGLEAIYRTDGKHSTRISKSPMGPPHVRFGSWLCKNAAPRKLQRKVFLRKPAPGARGAY
jgi:hypothetical protein